MTADSLPTVQIDGVVWQHTVIGDTVYAVGRFNTARPAGAAAGSQTTPRRNILAFSLSTGRLITTCTASLDAQALAVAASPDGTRLYVGGDFTQVNGRAASRVVALNPTTGAIIPGWAPAMSSSVRAIVATPETVYLGGAFNSVGSTSRSRLAAARASDGSRRPWRPSAGVEDCLGDSLSVFATDTAVYKAGHPHDCSRINGYPEVTPRDSRHGDASCIVRWVRLGWRSRRPSWCIPPTEQY